MSTTSTLSNPSNLQALRSWIYDTIIVGMTRVWYREVLTRLPAGAHVLDVGIGTATSLVANRDLVASKQIRVTGVDYDEHYVITAQQAVAKHEGLSDAIDVVHASIHDYHGGPFDAIYFSGSFMILPDKVKALQHCLSMLRSHHTHVAAPDDKLVVDGRLYFTQTFERDGFVGRYITPRVKQLLKLVLTIDFGTVTFENDFLAVLSEAGVEVEELTHLHSTLFRSQVVVVAKPTAAAAAIALV